MSKRILITGCSIGFGLDAPRTLAAKGHHVHATIWAVEGRSAPRATALRDVDAANDVSISVHEMDVRSDESVRAAVSRLRRLPRQHVGARGHERGHAIRTGPPGHRRGHRRARPLRTIAGPDFGFQALNDATEPVRRASLQAMGIDAWDGPRASAMDAAPAPGYPEGRPPAPTSRSTQTSRWSLAASARSAPAGSAPGAGKWTPPPVTRRSLLGST